MARVKLPAGPRELTAEWLTTALRETGIISASAVTGFDYEIIGQGVGVMGQLARFRLQYDKPEDGAPASLVAKFPATAQENRELANMLRFYEREVRFYEQIADAVELRTPKRYYSRFDSVNGEFVLLIEDMAPWLCGDQVAGCSSEKAATLIREIAGFHATWWNKVDTPHLDWIPYGNDPVHYSVESSYNDAWENFTRNFGDRLSPRAMAIAERLKTKIIAIENAIASPPMTIAHGDLRYDNLFFSADREMAVADWQIILRARGPYDIAYFMSQSVNPADRRACEMGVLRSYHETLLERGVEGYGWEQCFDDYRTSAMFCLVYPVIPLGSLDLANERGVKLFTAMLDRCVATILDLDCDEMIPA
jgi:Ecdysteroid kinase-like family